MTVETLLLQSDLQDCMEPGTGYSKSEAFRTGKGVNDAPLLVQVVSITDVGVSALELLTVRLSKMDGESDLQYPRKTLMFHLSDGSETFAAFEYKPVQELNLDSTPLGYKVSHHPRSFNLVRQ